MFTYDTSKFVVYSRHTTRVRRRRDKWQPSSVDNDNVARMWCYR